MRLLLQLTSAVLVILHTSNLLVSAQCPSGQTSVGSKCYYISTSEKTYANAQSDCAGRSGVLATISDEATNAGLKGALDTGREYWTGLQERIDEWKWLQGDQLIQYQGCFRDNTEDNKISTVLSQQRLFDQSTNMKVQDCTAACQSYGFAGLRSGKWCFCGNKRLVRAYASEKCDEPCTGDSSQTCGASKRLAIYNLAATETYNGWSPGQPDNNGGYQACLQLDGYLKGVNKLKWVDKKCSDSEKFVCLIPGKSSSECTSLGSEYRWTDNKCYYISPNGLAWFAADASCKNLGGNLLTLDTKAKHDAFKTFMDNVGISANIWVNARNTKYTWLESGVAEQKWIPWRSGQPNSQNEQCVVVQNGEFSDKACTESRRFVCTIGSAQVTTTTTPATTTSTTTASTTTVDVSTSSSVTSKGPVTNVGTQSSRVSSSTTKSTQTDKSTTTQSGGAVVTTTTQATTTSKITPSTPSTKSPVVTGSPGGSTQSTSSSGSGGASTSTQKTTTDGDGGSSNNLDNPDEPLGLAKGVWVAIAVACVAVLVAILRLMCYCCCRSDKSANAAEKSVVHQQENGEHLYAIPDKRNSGNYANVREEFPSY